MDDPNKITYFAKTNSRGKEVPFGIKRKDRARHMYVIGKTGVGKSTLLENLAIQDIRNGEGVAFIDPHGSTAEKLLDYVPEHRIKDVVYFAPFDMDNPIAFNVMEDVGYDKRHLVVSGLMSAFQKIWVDAWSARMEYILSNALLALLEYPDSTLLDVNTMLINKTFRQKVVDNVKDPLVKKFWAEEFAGYSDRYTQDATPAIQNKIGQFSNNPLIRNIIGQPKSSFDMRKAMDEKKILIFNLSKGRVGDVNTRLLGSILVTKLYLSAMSRADVPPSALNALPNFYFYVDEFQNFANKSFADILSEARKYKLNLIIAHQYVEQMEEEVRDAVFGNVGTTVVFRVGPFDAKVLETLFEPHFEAADLVNLGMGQIYLTLMIDGIGSRPFSATTLPPFDQPPAIFTKEIVEQSRAQFAKPRAEVEAFIAQWQATEAPPEEVKKPRAPRAPVGKPPAARRSISDAETLASAVRSVAPSPQPIAPTAPESTPRPARPEAPAPRAEASRHPQEKPNKPQAPSAPVSPERPPLEGSVSLKEALAGIHKPQTDQSHKAEVKQSAPKPQHQKHEAPKAKKASEGDRSPLKDALERLAAQQQTKPPAPPAKAAEQPHQKQKKQGGIPNDELKKMLDLGEIHNPENDDE
ncbi:MAG TPA: type IV secretion system DNA-binding domain-containing protein [Candidatus Paceibacterota bacterium]